MEGGRGQEETSTKKREKSEEKEEECKKNFLVCTALYCSRSHNGTKTDFFLFTGVWLVSGANLLTLWVSVVVFVI
jgi:hypothetical protein